MAGHRIFTVSFASVYPHYVKKAERKGRTKTEVDAIVCWLTGYTQSGLQAQLDAGNDIQTFFAQAPAITPHASLITGVVCGVRVEAVEDPLMQQIRWLDKLVDELAQGRPLEKILRGDSEGAAKKQAAKQQIAGKKKVAKKQGERKVAKQQVAKQQGNTKVAKQVGQKKVTKKRVAKKVAKKVAKQQVAKKQAAKRQGKQQVAEK